MRYFVVVLLVAGAACSSKDRSAPRQPPVATGTSDVTAPPLALVEAGPPAAGPATARVVHCKSPDGRYRVDLDLHGLEPQPRTAKVLVDGHDPASGGSTGVVMGGRFPPPGALTCSKSDDPSNTGCYVENTADYGYIVNVSLDKQGKRTVELRQNGVASTHLATLDCEK